MVKSAQVVKIGRPCKVQALHDQFAIRLNRAADNDPNCPPKFHGQLVYVVDEMAKRNKQVSLESIRKWFSGETMPSNDKAIVLADVFQVDFAWLTGGEQEANTNMQRKIHSSMASAVTNILAGVIALDGGHPAFPLDDDERARRDGADLYAVIRGVNYSFQTVTGEITKGRLVFHPPATRGMVLVIGVVRRDNNQFDFYELDADILSTGARYARGLIEINMVDGDDKLRKIETFTQRL